MSISEGFVSNQYARISAIQCNQYWLNKLSQDDSWEKFETTLNFTVTALEKARSHINNYNVPSNRPRRQITSPLETSTESPKIFLMQGKHLDYKGYTQWLEKAHFAI